MRTRRHAKQSRSRSRPLRGRRSTAVSLLVCAVASVFVGSSVGITSFGIKFFPLRIVTLIFLIALLVGRRRSLSVFDRRVATALLCAALYGLLSLVWSPSFVVGLRSLYLLITGLLLTGIVYDSVRDERMLRLLLVVWAFAAGIVGCLGLYEAFSGVHLFTFQTQDIDAVDRAVRRAGWVFPRVFSANWNNFAFINSISALILLAAVFECKGVMKWIAVLGCGLMVTLVYYSYSRAATLGVLIGFCTFLLTVIISAGSTNRSKTIATFLLSGIVVVSMGFGGLVLFSGSVVIEALMSKWEASTDEGRWYYYSMAAKSCLDSFGLGRGLGASVSVIAGGSYHSFFMEMLSELGIVIYVILIRPARSVVLTIVSASRNPRLVFINSAIISSLAAFPVLQFGPSSIMGEGVFWLWMGMVASWVNIVRRSGDRKRI